MTARIRLNEKKGIFLLILFTTLLVYVYLMDENILPKDLTAVFDNIQTHADADLPSTPSSFFDSVSLYSRMKCGRVTRWFNIQHYVLTILF
jgi:hypothetical protein